MSTFNKPTAAAPVTLVRAAQVNDLADATKAAFDLLPSESDLRSASNYAVSTGSGNAYLVTLPYAPGSYFDGLSVLFKANHANTGAATVNVNSLGVKSLKRNNGDALVAGDLPENKMANFRYNATSGFFEMLSQSAQIATAAAAAAEAAAISEINAGKAETAAADYSTKAGKWAEEAEDVAVETGKYSAKHHAAKAAAYFVDHAGSTDGHPEATAEAAGMMSAVDKQAVDALDTMATQAANNVAITGGSANGMDSVAVSDTTDATSTTDAPLKSAGGLAVAKDEWVGGSRKTEGYTSRAQSIASVSSTQQIRIPLALARGAHYMRVMVAMGVFSDATDRHAVAIKEFTWWLRGSQDIHSKAVDFRLPYLFVTTEIDIVHTGANDIVDLIVKYPDAADGTTLSARVFVEIIGTLNTPTINNAIVEAQ